jgi:hypothetical protein
VLLALFENLSLLAEALRGALLLNLNHCFTHNS